MHSTDENVCRVCECERTNVACLHLNNWARVPRPTLCTLCSPSTPRCDKSMFEFRTKCGWSSRIEWHNELQFSRKRCTWLATRTRSLLCSNKITYARLWHCQHAWQWQPFAWRHISHTRVASVCVYVCALTHRLGHGDGVGQSRGDNWHVSANTHVCVSWYSLDAACHHYVCGHAVLFGVKVQNGQMWLARALTVQ